MIELRGKKSLCKIQEESGIDRGQLKRYEVGRIPIDELLEKLAAFYGVSYDDLKELALEDTYPAGSKARAAVVKWVDKLNRESDKKI